MQLAERTRVTSPAFAGDPRRPSAWIARRGEVLRELPGRSVFRAEIGGQRVVVKEFTPRRLRHWIRRYAETEADNALAVARRGVPVVEPLACARLADGRQLLVLREEPGARTLQELVLARAVTGHARHELAKRVGELMARMQNAGIRHRDPHAGNVLVRPDGTVLLADAWDLRPGDYLTMRERARALADFALFFLKHGNLVDLLLFWGAYGRAAELLPEQLEELRAGVLRLVPDAFRRLSGMRARKVRRLGRAVKAGPFAGIVTGDLPPERLEAIVRRTLDLRAGPDVLKASPTAWTFAAGDDCVAKVFLPKKATRPLRDLLCGTRAERALEGAEALFHRGLRTPPVLAVLRDTGTPGRSLLVLGRVRDARPVEDALRDAAPAEARRIAALVGRTLRRMHDWGLRHRDLKRDNLLLAEGNGELCFLDLDGVRQAKGPLDWTRRARDLARLGGSLLDTRAVPTGLQLRALDAYLGGEVPKGHASGEFPRLVLRLARERRERDAGP